MIKQIRKHKELENFPFPLIVRFSEIDDRNLNQKLPLELFLKHEGYKIVIDKKEYVLSISNYSDFPRDSLKLEISTWRGSSPNAVHFYGSLLLPNINFVEPEEDIICAGYGIPAILKEIELHRPLTKEEIIENPDRYLGYNPGEMIYPFKSKEDIFRRAKIISRKYFPGFRLIFSDED